MTDAETPLRSRDKARSALLDRLERTREDVQNETAREILTPELAGAVFDLAWNHQFDKDRTGFINKVKDRVNLAVQERLAN